MKKFNKVKDVLFVISCIVLVYVFAVIIRYNFVLSQSDAKQASGYEPEPKEQDSSGNVLYQYSEWMTNGFVGPWDIKD